MFRSRPLLARHRPSIIGAVLITLATMLLSACSPFNRSVPERTLLESGEYSIVPDLDVPHVRGVNGCGAQALATVIAYVQRPRVSDHDSAISDGASPGVAHSDGEESTTTTTTAPESRSHPRSSAFIVGSTPPPTAAEIAADLPWHDSGEGGATPVDLLLEARHRGLNASIARGSIDILTEHIDSGTPVLVMLDAGVEVRGLLMRYPTAKVMHWAVVSGIAHDQSAVLLATEGHRHNIATMSDFDRRWSIADNCMIVVTPRTADRGSEGNGGR